MYTVKAISTNHRRARAYSVPRGTMLLAAALAFMLAASPATASTDDLALPKAKDEMSVVDWAAYSSRLVDGLRSSNDGIMQSALRLSIQYAGFVDVSPALLEVMKVYREHDDERVRHLAVVALASTGSRMALGYLQLSKDFESSAAIKRTIKAVTAEAG
jgi:hypothetical protein